MNLGALVEIANKVKNGQLSAEAATFNDVFKAIQDQYGSEVAGYINLLLTIIDERRAHADSVHESLAAKDELIKHLQETNKVMKKQKSTGNGETVLLWAGVTCSICLLMFLMFAFIQYDQLTPDRRSLLR